MPKEPKAAGTAPEKKIETEKPAYLREIEIRYKKKRVKAGSPVGKRITGAEQVFALFSDLQNEAKEKLITISLDVKLKIICFEVVAIGSVSAIYARPVEAIRAAIPMNPYGIIVVHNHPSGEPEPSDEDKAFTEKLLRSTRDLGIEFHDHVIIGDGAYYSFAEKGLMEESGEK